MRMNNGYPVYNQKLAEAKEQGMSLKDALDYATGEAAEEGDQTLEDMGNNVVDENGEDAADLGGILLSPVFYLINFVADAVISNLGRIMIGNDATFANVTGTKILQDAEIPRVEGQSYQEVEVDMESNFVGQIQFPNIPYTPETIFSGKVDLLSIDFISGKSSETDESGNLQDNSNSDWISIRSVISQWYQVLKMIAIIGLLSVLIYTGIKIIISANAKDKAKYKEWIINWFMAVAILFSMHLIMAFIVSVTGELSTLIDGVNQEILIKCDGKESVTNLMGLVRFNIQSEDFYKKVGYEVMYIALIVYTVKFTIVYLKRVLSVAFLTLIAPIVALTYPIDKINDGRAQGFDMWLKEYIFNALLQPMHLIMYYILVGSAVGIAASNPIYGIVVLAFMAEAEKLLKRIFGFDKASGGTVGGMAGAFAAGAIASNIKDIARMAKLPSGNGGKGGSDSSGSNDLMENVKPLKDKGIADKGQQFQNSELDGNGPTGGSGSGSSAPENPNSSGSRSAAAETVIQNVGPTNNVPANTEADSAVPDSEESAPEGTAPAESASAESVPAETAPAETAPAESASAESAPAETAPAESAPAESAPAESALAETAPAETAPAESASTVPAPVAPATPSRWQTAKNKFNAATKPIKDMAKDKYEEKISPENREKIEKVGRGTIRGVKNLGNSAIKPIWDRSRDKAYNKERYKRRIGNAGKRLLKATAGATLGVAAAAVQAGISITDGKYNPLEGIATFSAGYAGGSKLASTVGGKISNSFKEGYYSGDEGQKMLIEKQKKEFMYRDDVDEKYKDDWNDPNDPNKANKMKKLASEYLIPYGITDFKKQKSILKFAEKIAGKDPTPEKMKAAVERARRTQGFIETLGNQGQKGIITDPDKQKKYIQSMIKAEGLDKTNPEHQERIQQIENNYNIAFKSAAQWYQVNKS